MMSNELSTLTKQILTCDKNDLSKTIMGICRATTPQFYKNMSVEDTRAERLSIELLTQGIDNNVLSEMCKRAVNKYKKERAEDSKQYFDINYILKFYKDTFNDLYCNYITLNKGAELVSREYDNENSIMTELWNTDKGIVTIKCICDKEIGTHKDFESTFGVKWRPKTSEFHIRDFTDEELLIMFDDLDKIEL